MVPFSFGGKKVQILEEPLLVQRMVQPALGMLVCTFLMHDRFPR